MIKRMTDTVHCIMLEYVKRGGSKEGMDTAEKEVALLIFLEIFIPCTAQRKPAFFLYHKSEFLIRNTVTGQLLTSWNYLNVYTYTLFAGKV
jgi:hypothetical protein